MDVVLQNSGFAAADCRRRLAGQLANLVAATLFGSLSLAAVFFLARRFLSGIDTPLSTFTLVLCGIVLAAAVVAPPFVVERMHGNDPSRQRRILAITLPGVAALLVASALSLPGSSAFGLVALWGLISLGTVVAIRRQMTRVNPRTRVQRRPCAPVGIEEELSGEVNQRWIRRREEDGTDVIEGWVRTDFAAGARVAHVDATFCPPFASTPVVEAEPVEGPPAALKMGPVFPHGARVEIRLERPATAPTSVAIALFARGSGVASSPS